MYVCMYVCMYKIYLLKRYDNEAHKYVNHEEGNDDNIDNVKYGHSQWLANMRSCVAFTEPVSWKTFFQFVCAPSKKSYMLARRRSDVKS